jgi:uncharacterized membrane protein
MNKVMIYNTIRSPKQMLLWLLFYISITLYITFFSASFSYIIVLLHWHTDVMDEKHVLTNMVPIRFILYTPVHLSFCI